MRKEKIVPQNNSFLSNNADCAMQNIISYLCADMGFIIDIFAVPPTFVFSDDSILFEERIALLGSDAFINCSVNYGTEYNITSWSFDYEPLLINQTSKYSQNTSGLTVYNVTELDKGNYICYVDQLLLAIIVIHIECKIVISFY